MADSAEEMVAQFITCGGHTFIATQYEVAFNKEDGNGGSCPDILALDFANKEIVIVEVSVAADIGPLCKRIREREAHWIIPLSKHLETLVPETKSWSRRFLAFVRGEVIHKYRSQFRDENRVSFYPVQYCHFSWEYWKERQSGRPLPSIPNNDTRPYQPLVRLE